VLRWRDSGISSRDPLYPWSGSGEGNGRSFPANPSPLPGMPFINTPFKYLTRAATPAGESPPPGDGSEDTESFPSRTKLFAPGMPGPGRPLCFCSGPGGNGSLPEWCLMVKKLKWLLPSFSHCHYGDQYCSGSRQQFGTSLSSNR